MYTRTGLHGGEIDSPRTQVDEGGIANMSYFGKYQLMISQLTSSMKNFYWRRLNCAFGGFFSSRRSPSSPINAPRSALSVLITVIPVAVKVDDTMSKHLLMRYNSIPTGGVDLDQTRSIIIGSHSTDWVEYNSQSPFHFG